MAKREAKAPAKKKRAPVKKPVKKNKAGDVIGKRGPQGRPVGKTGGRYIGQEWVHIFATNAKKKLTDAQITAHMNAEYPGRESGVFNRVQDMRAKYNRGGFGQLTNGKPKTKSIPYHSDGTPVAVHPGKRAVRVSESIASKFKVGDVVRAIYEGYRYNAKVTAISKDGKKATVRFVADGIKVTRPITELAPRATPKKKTTKKKPVRGKTKRRAAARVARKKTAASRAAAKKKAPAKKKKAAAPAEGRAAARKAVNKKRAQRDLVKGLAKTTKKKTR